MESTQLTRAVSSASDTESEQEQQKPEEKESSEDVRHVESSGYLPAYWRHVLTSTGLPRTHPRTQQKGQEKVQSSF